MTDNEAKPTWEDLSQYLEDECPREKDQLKTEEDYSQWLNGDRNRRKGSLFHMSVEERKQLNKKWIEELLEPRRNRLLSAIRAHQNVHNFFV